MNTLNELASEIVNNADAIIYSARGSVSIYKPTAEKLLKCLRMSEKNPKSKVFVAELVFANENQKGEQQ